MIRSIFLAIIFCYLISCSRSDSHQAAASLPTARALKASLGHSSDKEKAQSFDAFVQAVSKEQMIAAADEDLQTQAARYFPDTTVATGYDMHASAVGTVDSFQILYYEYFDLYETWHNSYVGVFSPTGEALAVTKLWDISFEGNLSIQLLQNEILEVAYYDFFDRSTLQDRSVLPANQFYLPEYEKRNDRTEGYIYAYYRIDLDGQLQPLSGQTDISEGRLFPQASAKLLSEAELLQYPLASLELMGAELLAEHGHVFSSEHFKAHFAAEDWYHPLPQQIQIDSLLSDIETLNLKAIRRAEQAID